MFVKLKDSFLLLIASFFFGCFLRGSREEEGNLVYIYQSIERTAVDFFIVMAIVNK